MKEEKKKLRAEILQRMNTLSEEQYTTLSEKIADSLYKQREWIEAKTIGITLSMEREVDTYAIIEKAWEEGKSIVVPKCNRETRTMAFRQITSFEQLETVYMNLREPALSMTEEIVAEEIDLLVVPGVAFTRKGERIGYGGGYYDRYLVNYKGKALSLIFDFQIVSHIPVEPFDKNVQRIITEKETFATL
ncbi:5-formyltetrahydrofolate cyclo-ligase [Bacillus cytotoxicus]|uniref:5-formyltetrahydrofolate cyclo-ligase n=1 Tax=Bacillus cytotoxicus TaxID=580165 RepID=A0ACC6A537_9BACI|nr:5-formyltetrahydrofolate cyclo-ligase [Bacillus cytotoxicus]